MTQYSAIVEMTHELIDRAGTQWKLADGTLIWPDREDVRKVLDKAQTTLYTGDNDQIEVAGLLIRRNGTDLDVYVKAGQYEGAQ